MRSDKLRAFPAPFAEEKANSETKYIGQSEAVRGWLAKGCQGRE
jgi:hypothetical protein